MKLSAILFVYLLQKNLHYHKQTIKSLQIHLTLVRYGANKHYTNINVMLIPVKIDNSIKMY